MSEELTPLRTIDVAILGAGPAGLAAAHALRGSNRTVMLFEAGSSVEARSRHRAADLVAGVGGAGLYSDGKLSFFPSATALWNLADSTALKTSYQWLSDILAPVLQIPKYPTRPDLVADENKDVARSATIEDKRYVSLSVDFPTRQRLIEDLEHAVATDLRPDRFVESIYPTDPGYDLTVTFGTKTERIAARSVIVAGGRFGGLATDSLRSWVPYRFRRFEFGIRIEGPAANFFLRDHPSLDPKIIRHGDGGREWRTFCTCRNGEVVETNFHGLSTYSGRSDIEPTKFSNVGFNVRFAVEPAPGSELAIECARVIKGDISPFRVGLVDYQNGLVSGYGPVIDGALREGLESLAIGPHERELVVTGPCVEGVGNYPNLTANLQVPGRQVWFAGDQTGTFRGLTAAFVSGYYVGLQAMAALSERSTITPTIS